MSSSSSSSSPVESKSVSIIPASATIIPDDVAAWAEAFSKDPHSTRQQDSAFKFGIQALSINRAIQRSHDHMFSHKIPKEVRLR